MASVVLLAVGTSVIIPLRPGDVATFGALTLCAAIYVEALRRLDAFSGLTRDLLGAWWLPVVLLLPPTYALFLPIPVYVLLHLRIHRTVIHRRIFNAASVALAGFVSSVVFHAVLAPGLGVIAVSASVAEESLINGSGVFIAMLCCALFTVVNTAIVTVATHLGYSESPQRRPLWDREALLIDGVELCVGVTVAILSGISVLLLFIALPPVLLLQRSLLFQQLQAAARSDPKTGLLNAATWEQEADAELARDVQAHEPAALLVIDIDHFKSVNDTYGHLFGDRVLIGVATTLVHQARATDTIGRFGGEEFVALLPGADMAEACRAAERLRLRVGRMGLWSGDTGVTVTVSIGIALFRVHGTELTELLAAADLALYRAKSTGRNRVRLPVTGPSPIPEQHKRSEASSEVTEQLTQTSVLEPE